MASWHSARLIWVDCCQILLSEGVPHPFGIAVYGDLIYWTDWHTHRIESADKLNGSRRRVVFAGHDDLMDVHVFNRRRPTGITCTTCVSTTAGVYC